MIPKTIKNADEMKNVKFKKKVNKTAMKKMSRF